MEDELLAITNGIQDTLTLPDEIIHIPLEELQSNGSQWKNAWIFTLWKGEHLNPSQVIHAVQMKLKISNEKRDMAHVAPNKFVCKIHAKDDDEKVHIGQPWQVMNCLIIMKRFSSPTKSEAVVLDRIPLRLCFQGLLLEHLNKNIVQRVVSIAGIVGLILPENGLPKNVDGFRASVEIDMNQPIKKGSFVESIER
ncbi:hypothetical protein FRX31_014061 [Thalictrum thalictroides]|uniref:DUF4283 domain-containing protein n=1 Tax=Thalictrum thalictroides TaxID=46969 RepID=A0A7J6WJQ6_THATH|nr:hypothetical protein FRX31_014061 [Thalictrum thalictroides]